MIRGNLDLLKRKLSRKDRQESLRAIEAETARMTKIVGDLLLLAEVESGQVERQEMVSLREILRDGLARGQQLAVNHKVVIAHQEAMSIS